MDEQVAWPIIRNQPDRTGSYFRRNRRNRAGEILERRRRAAVCSLGDQSSLRDWTLIRGVIGEHLVFLGRARKAIAEH